MDKAIATHTFTLSGLGEAPFQVVEPKQHALEAGRKMSE